MSDKFGEKVSETRDDLQHLKLGKNEEEECKESKDESARKEETGSPSRKIISSEEPPEPQPGTSGQQMQLFPEDESVFPEAEMQTLPSRDKEKNVAGTKEEQEPTDFAKMPHKNVVRYFMRDDSFQRESTPSEEGNTLSDVSEICTQTAGSSMEESVYHDAPSSVKSEPSVSLYHDAVESQNADHSDSNSLAGLPSLTSSEPTGVSTVSTPTEEQGNDAYMKRLEQEARERGSPQSTSSGTGSANLDWAVERVEGERLRIFGQYDVPVMRDVVPSQRENVSEEQGHEEYMEELNKEARQRNYDTSSSDASSVEHPALENFQKWMDKGKRTKSDKSPDKVGGEAELSKCDGGSEKIISPLPTYLEGCEQQDREVSEPSSSSSEIGSGELREMTNFEKWLSAGKNVHSFDDSEKREENKQGKKSSFAKEVECSIKDQKPGPRLKVKYATIPTPEEMIESFGTVEPVPDTDPTLKESGMSPKQMEVGSPVEPEFVPEITEKRDVTLENVSILQSVLPSLKTPDLEETNLHGNEAVQSTSRHGMESELTSVQSRASFSETSNIKDENTDFTVSSGIKSPTKCIKLDEVSKTGAEPHTHRKSWQKSGSLRKLQHSTISSMESTEENVAPFGIEEPITDVEIEKSPEQMDVSLPSADTTDPERALLHEMEAMQSASEHGLASTFQSEESRRALSDASDFKDGRPDSRLSSSSAEPFSTSSEFSHVLGSSIESSESEGTTMLRSAPKPGSQLKMQYATVSRIETIEEERVTEFKAGFERNVEHQTKDPGMSSEQMEMGSPVEREITPEKDETVKVQSESGDTAPDRSLSGSETKRPSVSIPVSKSEKQSSKPERKTATSAMATCASKSGKRSRKKARIDKDKKVKHPVSPKKRVRRLGSGSASESTGELSGSGTDSDYSAGN
ncbi:hypothetical protein TNIN_237821 [Trichonephila inaurata madagascariensis]|uniref:Uncharacterized protein n=1 Tax=Trichonephila inaurata madagascariensis TaxID=2747483 RepID=A0A8X6Y6H8_9ARAC|nr:hypothetical protein TNIN_237821 [Trichonephila inaurata madagascariensis]